jgi:hypothetical protein
VSYSTDAFDFSRFDVRAGGLSPGLDHKFRDRAPHVERRSDGKGYFFVRSGISPFPVTSGFGTGRSGMEWDFEEVLEDVRHKIVYDNAATLYGIAH